MNGRISLSALTFAAALICSGCISNQKLPDNAIASGYKPEEVQVTTKKTNAPKKNPQAVTEIAFGKYKEASADSEIAKGDPEAQSRLRDDARKAYQNALKLEPTSLEAFRCLGALYVKTNDFERAMDVYKKALAKHPSESILWYDVALCFQRRKELPESTRFSESVRCLNKAIEMDPENPTYLVKLGFTLAWMGQLEQGLTYLSRAQGAAQAHYNIARILLQRDQTQLARYHLNIALQQNSQLVEARQLLTVLDSPSARN